MNQLPPGFALDSPTRGAYPGTTADPMGAYIKDPKLPAGFQLDEPQASQPVQRSGMVGGGEQQPSNLTLGEAFNQSVPNFQRSQGIDPSLPFEERTAGTGPGTAGASILQKAFDPQVGIDYAKNAAKFALGTAENVIGSEKFTPYSNEQQVASDFWGGLKNYTSGEGIKKNLASGQLYSDAIALLSPGGGAAARVAAAKPAAELESELATRISSMKKSGVTNLEAAKNSGASFTPAFSQSLNSRLNQAARGAEYRADDPSLGKSTFALKAIEEAASKPGGITIKDLHYLRRKVDDAANDFSNGRPTHDAAVGQAMKGVINTAFERLQHASEHFTPEQLNTVLHVPEGADATTVAKQFRQGLSEYHAAKQAETIERVMGKAGVSAFNWSQSGAANAIKTAFRNLYKNDRQLRGYDPTEQAMIKNIAKGGGLSDHLIEIASKYAVHGIIAPAVAHTLGGLPGVLAMGGIGEVARNIAEKRQRGRVDRLQNYILSKPNGELAKVVGQTMYDHIQSTPQGMTLTARYLGAVKGAAKVSARQALALFTAQQAREPKLYSRILKELEASEK